MQLNELNNNKIDFNYILEEGINYKEFFSVFDGIPHAKSEVLPYTKWAKSVLKKQDRIIWFLRLVKLKLMNQYRTKLGREVLESEIIKYNKKTKGKKIRIVDVIQINLNALQNDLIHFLSLNQINKIQTTIFKWELPIELVSEFQDHEIKWRENLKGLIPIDSPIKVFLKLDSKFAWYDLDKASCDFEGSAMGHCGNSPMAGSSNHTILSLREIITKGKDKFYKPVATFILDKRDDSLGEMKGKFNEKPDKKYHKYIVDLIMDKRIKSIEGGGYLPQSNFNIKDLPDAEFKSIVKKKPALMESLDYISMFGLKDDHSVELIEKHTDIIVNSDRSYVVLHSYPSLGDIVDDIGDYSFKQYIKLIDEGETHELTENNARPDRDSFEHTLSTNQMNKLKDILEKNYPEDWKLYDGEWFRVFEDALDGDEQLEEIEQTFRYAEESGTVGDIIEAMKEGVDGFGDESDLFDINRISDGIFDSKYELIVYHKQFINFIEEIDETDIENLESEFDEGLSSSENQLKLNVPYHGFNGFDEKYFKEEIDRILKL